jgi:predicted MFS family arabinose efflux permease
MLVVIYFHQLGYSPIDIAALFLFYEFFGIVTNLLGGWLGARIGLNNTMHAGMLLQVLALLLLTVPDAWLSVIYVMGAQALSGIAKDLNKMSAKASLKTFSNHSEDTLFKWVAILTGSKNTLKGVGFFLGGALLHIVGFRSALFILATMLLIALVFTFLLLPKRLGVMRHKPKISALLSTKSEINSLSAARFFLFGARDVWFVVALPCYLYEVLFWSAMQVGSFFALWVIVYGLMQAMVPLVLNTRFTIKNNKTAFQWALWLLGVPALTALMLSYSYNTEVVLLGGLFVFAVIFAVNSALHSYLILAYSNQQNVSLNVGFYYMANAGGRLTGTLISGWVYQAFDLEACLWVSSAFIAIAALLSLSLPKVKAEAVLPSQHG